MIVATFIPHILSSYRHTSDIVTRADFDAQYAPIKQMGARPKTKFVRPYLILQDFVYIVILRQILVP